MIDLLIKLKTKPIVAGIKTFDDIIIAIEMGVQTLFILHLDIFDMIKWAKMRDSLEKKGIMVFPHLDLLKGVAADKSGINFLHKEIGVTGIISTQANLLKYAQKEGLLAIQPLFIIDSESLRTGLEKVKNCSPDGIQLMPSPVLTYVKDSIPLQSIPPIIAGGLIRTKSEVEKMLSLGAVAISTSNSALWSL
jgi:glycerol uptake operon antiterminator